MADVRLTAVNPEDSQVYPVACNDKGELLLDSGGATGDLDVTGNLTVAGNTTGGGGWQSSPTEGGYRLHAGFGQLALSTPDTGSSGNFIQCQSATGRAFQVAYDGSADFVAGKFQARNVSGAGVLELQTAAGAQTVLLDGRDGSAVFSGRLQIGGWETASNGYGGIFYSNGDGTSNLAAVYARNMNPNGSR